MENPEVLAILKNISEKVLSDKKLELINWGGCAYFVSFVKYHLDFCGIDSEIVYIDDRSNKPKQLVKNIKDRFSHSSTTHVALKIGDIFFDADGLHDTDLHFYDAYNNYDKLFSIVPFKMTALLYYRNAVVNKRGQWNPRYNYKLGNPILKEIINSNFEKWYIEKNLKLTKIKTVQKRLMSLE